MRPTIERWAAKPVFSLPLPNLSSFLHLICIIITFPLVPRIWGEKTDCSQSTHCKKSRAILYFSQSSCCMYHVNHTLQCNLIQMSQSKCILHLREISRWWTEKVFQRPRCKLQKKIANVWHPLWNLQCFSDVVALQVARKIASCNC